MIRLGYAAIGVILLGLAACASQRPEAPSAKIESPAPQAAAPPAEAPVIRKGRDWAFAAAGRDEPAKLGYGAPNSDDLDVMFWCGAAQQRVRVTPVGAEGETFKRATLQSGPASVDLSLVMDPRYGSVGDVRLGAPLLQAFAASGQLRMALDGKPPNDLNAASDMGRKAVGQFFTVCR